jgi:hypothetical protein
MMASRYHSWVLAPSGTPGGPAHGRLALERATAISTPPPPTGASGRWERRSPLGPAPREYFVDQTRQSPARCRVDAGGLEASLVSEMIVDLSPRPPWGGRVDRPYWRAQCSGEGSGAGVSVANFSSEDLACSTRWNPVGDQPGQLHQLPSRSSCARPRRALSITTSAWARSWDRRRHISIGAGLSPCRDTVTAILRWHLQPATSSSPGRRGKVREIDLFRFFETSAEEMAAISGNRPWQADRLRQTTFNRTLVPLEARPATPP